jgi:hypothetical protein
MKRLNQRRIHHLALVLVIVLGSLLGMLGFSLWDKAPTPVSPVAWSPSTQWIGAPEPSYRLYARHTLNLSHPVQAAWLRLSADNSFLLYVNGKQVGRQLTTTNSSLSFASRNTFLNQTINDSAPYEVKPENRFIGYHQNWKQTFYLDVSKALQVGKNTIAIEVQKPEKSVRFALEGYVYSVKGAKPIALTTGETPWKVAALGENKQRIFWYEPDFPDEGWAEANPLGEISEKTFSKIAPNLFDRALKGAWISGSESAKGELWLRGLWDIPKVEGRSFLRFAGDGEYSLLMNGQLVGAYDSHDKDRLHLFEVTDLLKKGENVLIARVAQPIAIGSTVAHNNPLGFFLDGWQETKLGEVTAEIATDTSWKASPKPIFEQLDRAAISVRAPDPQEFNRQYEGNAYLLNYPDFLLRTSFWQLVAIGLTAAYAWLLGCLWRRDRPDLSNLSSFNAGAALLLPGTLFLIGMGLLKHRYAESEQGLLFAQPSTNMLILLGFIGIQTLTLWFGAWRQTPRIAPINSPSLNSLFGNSLFGSFFLANSLFGGISFANSMPIHDGVEPADSSSDTSRNSNWKMSWNWLSQIQFSKWGQWILFGLIITVGFGLRAYHLDATARDSDENTSLDAIRGILRTGAPVATSGIWYTRGPLYHYVVALWLRLVGYSSENARFSSVLFGTITLVVVFFLVRKFTGKVWLALLVIAILAIDPWELAISRNTRFYQFLQMNVMFAFWFFAKGFIFKEGRIYQNLFFISTLAFLLTQEGYVTLTPCFMVGFLCFYRPFNLKKDWSILLGSAIVMSIYVFNGILFLIRCLTPPVGISSGSSIQIKLHLGEITGFTTGLLVGNSRINVLYSFFFLLGLAYFLIKKDGKIIFLFSNVCIFLFSITFLVIQISPRYTYGIYPLFVTLSVYSGFCILGSVGKIFESAIAGLMPLKAIALSSVILLFLFNIEPGRMLSGYQEALARQNPQLFEYVRQHLEPSDIVVANLPAAAAIGLNKLDYFLPSQGILSLDGFYVNQGRTIDRWAGGEVINNTDRFAAVLEKSSRVWIQLDDNPRPNEPNQRQLYDYARTLGNSVYEPYGVRLRLWQKEDGILPRDVNQGKDLGNY